jgi:molybdenum-dependent DNA-binding transcriptional regulator ModE
VSIEGEWRKKARRMAKRPRITRQEFLAAWKASRSIRDCAQRLGLSYQAAWTRADGLRRRGVKLKPIVKIYKPRRQR